jgi:hypothetical protein
MLVIAICMLPPHLKKDKKTCIFAEFQESFFIDLKRKIPYETAR